MTSTIDCQQCGVCCTAFDISSLKKKEGVRCKHLTTDFRCADYENRPAVCKDFVPDEICILISTLDFEDRLKVVRNIYGL